MNSMQHVSSALIARNESWVRKQASAMMRRMPSNVEKADLIQVGLIGVAQAALAFQWAGDRDSDEARQAFVRYAQLRVKGAMVDELRQMDQLGRAERRKLQVLQIARERWRALNGVTPRLGELTTLCGMSIDEIDQLDQVAQSLQIESLSGDDDRADDESLRTPCTAKDEVEARVDTAIVLRRLGPFFAALPERERRVIDAYLGIGLSPIELAAELNVTPSRVSQIYKDLCARIANQVQRGEQRGVDGMAAVRDLSPDELVSRREEDLERSAGSWGRMLEEALAERVGSAGADEPLVVDMNTRWG
ncbi:sigma-70 family RNA polymerase sigma factor [Aquincola sp. S2]|uniref:Sigma-70 family RNA polymerase sigma factor n=1 Tax=Pseudaquabacterium terrae TaxID=2732868 RepID=A0ABX2ERG5_9BURK|nr:sigma-70 family RNA polymerase sigma factor [Aquabacterium terrae]NRF71110.1 sigma-70 family RNA polymerase sigma factor [Aquabacterium terrae]